MLGRFFVDPERTGFDPSALWVYVFVVFPLGRAACVALLVTHATACGAPAVRAAEPAAREPGMDVAALLPAGSDHCSIARPSLVAERRRPLLALQPISEAIAWTRHPALVAFGSATVGDTEPAPTRFVVLRLAEPLGRDRAALAEALPLRVRFAGDPCRDDGCDLPTAEILDAWTVRIRRGPERETTRGESPCAALARAHPGALAVGVRRLLSACDTRERGCATSIREHVELTERGLERIAEHVYSSSEDAARDQRVLGLEREGTAIGAARVELHGAALREITHWSWEDLELAAMDEDIAQDAARRASEARTPLAVARVDVERLSVVLEQARLRRRRMSRARGPERRAQAEALVELFERALALRPDETPLAIEAARLALDELEDASRALRIVTQARGHALTTHRTELARVGREATSTAAPDTLVDALVEDAVAAPHVASAVAAQILAALREGAPYDVAEDLVVAAFEEPWVPTRPVPQSFGWTCEGAPLALAALSDMTGRSVERVVLRARGVPSGALLARYDGRVIALRADTESGAMIVGRAQGDESIAALGRAVMGLVEVGSVALQIDVLARDGSAMTLGLVGTWSALGSFVVERTSAWAGPPLELVERTLVAPFARLAARRYPAPSLVVGVDIEGEGTRTLSALGEDAARCELHGARLECRPDPARPDLMAELLVRVAASLLGL